MLFPWIYFRICPFVSERVRHFVQTEPSKWDFHTNKHIIESLYLSNYDFIWNQLHLGAGVQNNQTIPIAIFFSLFFLLQAAKQLDSVPDISFHENKKIKKPANIEQRVGGKGCQLRGSRLGGGSLDLVFNLAVLSPGRLAKVTEQ